MAKQPNHLSLIQRSVSGLKKYYSVPELVRISGLSRRQIDYWSATGLLAPTVRKNFQGGGKPSSLYSQTQALKLLIFSDLKARGFSLLQVRQLSQNFVAQNVRLDLVGSYLLTDGTTVLYAKNDNDVVDILKNNRQMLLIPIKDQMKRLRMVA